MWGLYLLILRFNGHCCLVSPINLKVEHIRIAIVPDEKTMTHMVPKNINTMESDANYFNS